MPANSPNPALPAAPSVPTLAVLAVRLNDQLQDEGVVVALQGDLAWLPESFLQAARLPTPAAASVIIDGQRYVPLDVLGARFRLDEANQQLWVSLPPAAFALTRLGSDPPPPAFSPVRRSARVNYNFSIDHSAGTTTADGWLEWGLSGPAGSLASNMIVSSSRRPIMLGTAFVRDAPAQRRRLILGDALSSGTSWSAPYRFTGLRLGTNFTLQPGFQTFPAPTLRGEAALPSDLALYVNATLSAQAQVDQGPFVFERVPTPVGAGRIELRIRDIEGSLRRITTAYYVSGQMLRRGLTSYSLEIGAERRQFGQESFAYGAPFLAGTYRRGLLPAATLEVHGEAEADLQGAGLGLAATLGTLAEAGGAIALSRGGMGGNGWLARGYAAHLGRGWSLVASYQLRSAGYTQLGNGTPPRELVQLSGGLALGPLGNATITATRIRQDSATLQLGTLGWSRGLGQWGNLALFATASQASGQRPATLFGLSLVRALGRGISAGLRADPAGGDLALQRSLPSDRGLGYRLSAALREGGRQQGELALRTPAFDAMLGAAQGGGGSAAHLAVSGGFLMAGGSILPARRLDGAFAIVDAGAAKGIRVLQDSRVVGRTNARGIAVVSDLRPFETNRIGLMQEDFAIDTRVGSTTIEVVPGLQTAVDARFEVSAGTAGTVILRYADGTPIEPGSPVAIGNGQMRTQAGEGGEVFIEDLRAGLRLTVEGTREQTCTVVLPAPPAGETMPQLGPFTCEVMR